MPNLHEICELRVSRGYNAVDVSFHLGPLVICECLVIFGQTSLPLSILQQQEVNHAMTSQPSSYEFCQQS